MQDIKAIVEDIAVRAREASTYLLDAPTSMRNEALACMAAHLRTDAKSIIEANEKDMLSAKESGTKESLLDRLMLDETRIEDMAAALEDLIELDDPLDKVLAESVLYNGMQMQRITVPLGVVAVVYEARPNVTADAAGICIKSGNACILRGGTMAMESNIAITRSLQDALAECELSRSCIEYIDIADRAATDALMQLHGIVDVLIPRGGAGLINHCVEHSKVPVIETGTGNCHVYVHSTADPNMARDIAINSKCRRYGVCNAAETLLLDSGVSDEVAVDLMEALAGNGVVLHADERAYALTKRAGIDHDHVVRATDADWETEYLSPDISVKFVDGVKEAIDHINTYGTKHSEAIVCEDDAAAEEFLHRVDAAAVYHNAATAFTDGGQFGLGAEIGISTQKLHTRGPFALDALTSYKYVLRGTGQVRS